MSHPIDDEWEQRVAGEFRQCPGLRLTPRQAGRLFGLDVDRVERILESLVAQHVLEHTANGTFASRR